MTPEDRRQLFDRYRQGPEVLEAALDGITSEELDHRPGAGEWSPREIVHHTADSETISGIRLRRLLAEDGPRIEGYDEAEFARRLFYDRRPIAPSLAAVRAARETSASIISQLDEAGWARTGIHSESGEYGVERWLEIYAAHCHDHAAQIRRAREAFGERA